MGRIGPAIRDDQQLARPCDHVDAHGPVYQPLGGRHEDVARPDDLVHAGNRLRAVSHGRDRLHAPDAVHLVHAGDVRRHQEIGTQLAFGRRHTHDDPFDPSHLGRDRAHQHRRRIDGLATRHVEPDHVQRQDRLAERDGAVLPHPGLRARLFPLVEDHDAVGCVPQRVAFFLADLVVGLLDLVRAHPKLARLQRDLVEPAGIAAHRGVSAPLHGLEDRLHRGFDLAAAQVGSRDDLFDGRLVRPIRRRNDPHERPP